MEYRRQLHSGGFVHDCVAGFEYCRGLDRDAKSTQSQRLEL